MKQLMKLLEYGVSPAHVIDYMKRECVENGGFIPLQMQKSFTIQNNEKYYVNLSKTSGMAIRTGNNMEKNPKIRIAVAHSDHPCFQLKPNPFMTGNASSRLNVELYGGMNQKSWMDRPLGVAGTIVVKSEDAFCPNTQLYKSQKPVAIIPSIAIHMERDLNKKGGLDVAKELVPIVALDKDVDLLQMIATELQMNVEDILDYDLFLYNTDKPQLCGVDDAMIASPRLDNLTSVAAMIHAMLHVKQIPDNTIDICVVFDHEEVGSLSGQGADSQLLNLILEKIGVALGNQGNFLLEVLQKGFVLSMDVAHACHPNYEEKSDATNKPYMGSGISLKRSVGQKYGTNAQSAAVVKHICQQEQIPYTVCINKTGIPGGSTLGPIVSSHIPFPCADIGMPILAMHSAMELGAIKDYEALQQFVQAYFEL